MRIVIHQYNNGGSYAFSTKPDGREDKSLYGARQPGERISAAIEVECDDNTDGRTAALRLLESARGYIQPNA